jgi:TonB-linked SusC/RagA family outer membrane protein
MKRILSLMLLLSIGSTLLGQVSQVNGKVTDTDGLPMPGVTVHLVGTTTGTITDVEGFYQVTAEEGVLRFSFIGFIPQEVELTGQATVNIVLLEEVTVLDEVVVIGYGVQKKKDITTAVSTVGSEAIKDRPIISPAEALQGQAAGVQVIQPSGKPGGDAVVRVRGSSSVLAGNDPLYVVDGVPTTDIRGINPSDIENMSILKDASSASIYGARAANGVVIITTKRGKKEEPTINFNTYYGFSRLRKTIDVLDTKDYRTLMQDIGITLDPTQTEFNNWQDIVFGTGQNQSYQLSFSGGTEKTNYFFSTGYLSEAGIVEPARFDRYSVRLNLDNQLTKWLKIGTNINYLHSRTKDTPDNASSGRGGVIMSTLNTPPFLNIWNEDGSGQYDPNPFQPSWENPVAYMDGPDQQATDDRLFGNIFAEITFLKDFTFRTNAGLDQTTHQWDYFLNPWETNYGRQQNGIGRSDKRNSTTWLWDNLLTYAHKFGKHNVNAMIGSSLQEYTTNDTYAEGNDYPAGLDYKSLAAANTVNVWTSQEGWSLASFFGRATYDYAGKYYLSVSLREDGSSKLAHHWGTMPAFSAGWRISGENFMQGIEWMDDLKIRGGWGKMGNQETIPNYSQYGLTSYYRRPPTNPLSGPAEVQVTYGNPDLRWETTAQTNIGFDLSLFRSRVIFNFDVYSKKTSDVILNVQLSNSLPITTIQTNAGDIENKGLEFNLSTVNIDRKLRWNTDLNMSFNRNEVTALEYTPVYYYGKIYSNNSEVSIVKVGLPLGTFFGYVSEGVDPETGDIIYKDVNENGIFDPGDRTVIGDANPDFIFGFTNTLSYHRFDLNIFFQGSVGNDIYNATRIDLEGMFDSKNQSEAVLDRWTPENTDTDIPRAVGGGNVDNVRNSTRFVENGTYVRLKALTLSYGIIENNPKIKAIKNLSVYVTGQNLLTFTSYSGFDPEVNAYGNSAVEQGIDYGTYPQAITLIFGLNLEF